MQTGFHGGGGAREHTPRHTAPPTDRPTPGHAIHTHTHLRTCAQLHEGRQAGRQRSACGGQSFSPRPTCPRLGPSRLPCGHKPQRTEVWSVLCGTWALLGCGTIR